MALVYRAHFALVSRPIYTSKGVNASALFVFTNTLLDVLQNQRPTHIAVAFDTEAPTERHRAFPDYKIQREAMPEDIAWSLPHVRRLLEAFQITGLTCDGYEADDIIGTLVRRAEPQGFECYMVTPDKDFGQLVCEKTFIYKPGRMGDAAELLALPEIREKWGVEKPDQVIDIIGLWGDASDNIPGVPGIGEKTASKLIAQYGSVENLLAHTGELKGKLRENLEKYRDQALLSKRLATINCDAPIEIELDSLKLRLPDEDKLKQLLIEFEFNSIGRRLFGEEFKAGRGFGAPPPEPAPGAQAAEAAANETFKTEPASDKATSETPPVPQANLKSVANVAHDYRSVTTASARAELIRTLRRHSAVSIAVRSDGDDPKQARLIGLAFSIAPHAGWFVPLPSDAGKAAMMLSEFRSLLEDERIDKVGHDLKFTLSALKWNGLSVRGKLFDVMLAHALIEPDLRHTLEFLAEVYLGYAPASAGQVAGGQTELGLGDA